MGILAGVSGFLFVSWKGKTVETEKTAELWVSGVVQDGQKRRASKKSAPLRRTKDGRFAKGNRGGPGRPRKPEPVPEPPTEVDRAFEFLAKRFRMEV